MSRRSDCSECGGVVQAAEVSIPLGLEPHRDDRITELVELCVGTSLRVAPMELLEAAVRMVRAAQDGAALHAGDGTICLRPSNMAVVSTCNRVEFYLAVEADAVEESIHVIHREVFEPAGLAVDLDHQEYVYVHRGADAVGHVCRVAAGLDSLAIGEHQIAGQVSRGFQHASEDERPNGTLVAMGEAARRASGRSRSETGIGGGKVSLSSVAVEVAERTLGSLDDKRVLVVGSGKVARLVCSSIGRASGATVVVTNRTFAKAEELAADFDAQAIEFDALFEQIATSDVVFTATGSTVPILTKDRVAPALIDRDAANPILIIDLAVPRDVEEEVENLDDVQVFGFDELRAASDKNLEGRRLELGRAEEVILEEVSRYAREREIARAKPLLAAVWQRAEQLRESELERLFGDFDGMDEATRERIEYLSRALVTKLLHEPSTRLRSASAEGYFNDYSNVVRHLFALDDQP